MITESPIRLSADAPARNSGGACMTSEQVELLIAVRAGVAAHAPGTLDALNFCGERRIRGREEASATPLQSDLKPVFNPRAARVP